MLKSSGRSAFTLAVTGLLVAAFVVLGKCAYDRQLRELDAEAMRVGAEDVARRLSENRVSLAEITELYDEYALAAARSLARIIANDPSVLKDRERYEALAKTVGTDEIHVSDENGVLIASVPSNYVGYAMSSSPQSAEFIPAISNREFALVQKAQPNGIEGKVFQYAAVSRIDRPGIVLVGQRPNRLETAVSVADYRHIASTARIGRGGYVRISLVDETDRIAAERSRTTIDELDGRRWVSLHTDCGSYRIVVTMPYRGWYLADDRPYEIIEVVIIALMVLMLLSGISMFGRKGFGRVASDLKLMLQLVRERGSGRRAGPVVIISAALLLIGVSIAWLASTRAYTKYYEEAMLHAMGDFVEDYSTAPDSCLYFVGNAITSHYRTPENAQKIDIHELMSRYGIDELNVVDDRGVVLRGDLANVGFDFHSNGNTMKFLRLLDKDWTYAQNFRAAIEDKSIVRKYAGVAFPRHDGFVQIGFDEKRIAENFDYHLENLARDWSVANHGYFVLARNDGRIVSSGHPSFKSAHDRGEITTLAGIGFDSSLVPDGGTNVFFNASLYDERCHCVSIRLGSYHRLIVATPIAAIGQARNRTVGFIGSLLVLVLGCASFFGSRLANLVARLRRFIDEDAKRRTEELSNARAIQTESLPMVMPNDECFAISARMDTAKEVGGDFYDTYALPDGRQLFLIADTSGKGIPAAMFMMKAKAIVRAGLFEVPDFATAVIEANDRLSENNDAMMFVTAWIGIYDRESGTVEYVNCGHNPPVLRHSDGTAEYLKSRPGPALAVMPGAKYRVEKCTLAPGEAIFLYTDGVTEAKDAHGAFFGEERLLRIVAGAKPQRMIDSVRRELSMFAIGAEQFDDITMLSLSRKTGEEKA